MPRIQCFLRPLAMMSALLALLSSAQCVRPGRPAGGRSPTAIRAVWVTRWDYKSRSDIAAVMDQCRRAGFNTVLFQVRGNGTVAYRSKIEPWSEDFGGRDPGFDPLAVACAEAHKRGLELHAWVNVVPGWRGAKPPADPRQLYHAHPEWFWYDAQGRRQPLGWYASLNPCLPEVRQYIVSVMHEIVRNYPVDGLHMDYIRFPNDAHEMYAGLGGAPDYPRDRRTLALFARDARGATPQSNPAAWNAWRTDQVTKLVRDIRVMVSRTKPAVRLSAAVGSFPDEAKRKHFQDAPRWVADGLVDAVYPMCYARDMGTFEQSLERWAAVRRRVPVVTGIMFDQREAALVRQQVARAVQSGRHFAAFAYNSLFERRDPAGRPVRDGQDGNRHALRAGVIPVIHSLGRAG